MSLLSSLLLGLIQGISEFLPISSSGHLSIAQNLLRLQAVGKEHLFFDVLLHLGTLAAVFVAYWQDVVDMLPASPFHPPGRNGSVFRAPSPTAALPGNRPATSRNAITMKAVMANNLKAARKLSRLLSLRAPRRLSSVTAAMIPLPSHGHLQIAQVVNLAQGIPGFHLVPGFELFVDDGAGNG